MVIYVMFRHDVACQKLLHSANVSRSYSHWRQTRRGCRRHIPSKAPIFWLEPPGRQWEYPHQYYYVCSDIADQYYSSSPNDSISWRLLSFCSKIQNLPQNRPKPAEGDHDKEQDSWAIAKKTARCAQYIGALKSFESPHYAPGYFSRNL